MSQRNRMGKSLWPWERQWYFDRTQTAQTTKDKTDILDLTKSKTSSQQKKLLWEFKAKSPTGRKYLQYKLWQRTFKKKTIYVELYNSARSSRGTKYLKKHFTEEDKRRYIKHIKRHIA